MQHILGFAWIIQSLVLDVPKRLRIPLQKYVYFFPKSSFPALTYALGWGERAGGFKPKSTQGA